MVESCCRPRTEHSLWSGKVRPGSGPSRVTRVAILPLLRVGDRHMQLQPFRQVGNQVAAAQEEQGEGSIDRWRRAVISTARPGAVWPLASDQVVGAPAVPILAADGPELIQHRDALDRPEEIKVWRRRVVALLRIADRPAQGV